MAGDGVSLPTTISQLGNVAKSQAKTQQTNQPNSPVSEQIDQSKDLKVNRVKKSEAADQNRIDPDSDGKQDKHKRKRKHKRKLPGDPAVSLAESGAPENDEAQSAAEEDAADVGRIIDTMA